MKPCAHCGQDHVSIWTDTWQEDLHPDAETRNMVVVECAQCGAGFRVNTTGMVNLEMTREDLINRWNRRVG